MQINAAQRRFQVWRAPPGGNKKNTSGLSLSASGLFLLSSSSVSVCRSSRAVPQPDVVPQPGPGSHIHPSDWLSQRPLHAALGQEEALHPGPVCGNADRSGSVPERIRDRQVWFCPVLFFFFFSQELVKCQ